MKIVEVSKEEIINFKKLNLISEIQSLKKALELFEKKYDQTLKDFERDMLEEGENFEKWDDYIEWKAYFHSYKEKMKNLKNLKNVKDIRLVTKQ